MSFNDYDILAKDWEDYCVMMNERSFSVRSFDFSKPQTFWQRFIKFLLKYI